MTDWKTKVILREGQVLRHVSSKTQGFMQETDLDSYEIVDAEGAVTGTVLKEEHIAVKGFKRTVRITQKDNSGSVIVDATLQE